MDIFSYRGSNCYRHFGNSNSISRMIMIYSVYYLYKKEIYIY